jgi:glycosyltransferase involved in cell wall biosynthesis
MERVICSLSRGFAAAGHSVRTFFPESETSPALLSWGSEQGVSIETHPAVLDAGAPHSPRSAIALKRLIADIDPDIVNVHYGDNALSLYDMIGIRSSKLRRPVLVSIHHPTPWEAANRRKRIMTGIGANMASRVVTVANATRDVLLAAGVPSRRIDVIPCGVPTPAAPVTRDAARRLLGVSDDVFVVGSLARLVPHKGIDLLIRAVDRPDFDDSVVLVAGDGPSRSELESIATSAKFINTRFLGRVADPGVLYAASDVFVLPSELEGFGLVYVEAATYGVPSVGFRVGGVPDAISDNETGILVEPGDEVGLSRAIKLLKADDGLRARLGRAAQERAMSDLSESTMVQRYLSLLAKSGVSVGST